MRISIIQPDIVWEDKTANLNRLGEIIKPIFNRTDIVILPEMFNTGFSLNPQQLCESAGQETFKWMENISRQGNFGLCGSFIVKENEDYFNRFAFVSPGNESWFYNKRHLFSMGGEEKLFTRGNNRLVFNFRGVRISPYICYDLRFPVWSRNRNDYDLLIYVANWPEVRSGVWNTLLKARAIENQCYVAGANRIGTDENGLKYSGESLIIDPRGEIISLGDKNVECSITGEISLSELSAFRAKFPVLRDADDFHIDL